MAVAYDSQNNGNEASAVASTSFSLSFVGSPNIVVITSGYCNPSASTVGGDACTAISTGAPFSETAMGYKTSPANGNVVVTYIFSWRGVWGASAYTGCDTADPIGVTGYASGSSATPQITLTSESASSLIVDNMYTDFQEPTATGTGQTRIYSVIGVGGSSSFRMTSSYTTGVAGSQTVSYSMTSATWEIEAIEILPGAGPAPSTPPPSIVSDFMIYN